MASLRDILAGTWTDIVARANVKLTPGTFGGPPVITGPSGPPASPTGGETQGGWHGLPFHWPPAGGTPIPVDIPPSLWPPHGRDVSGAGYPPNFAAWLARPDVQAWLNAHPDVASFIGGIGSRTGGSRKGLPTDRGTGGHQLVAPTVTGPITAHTGGTSSGQIPVSLPTPGPSPPYAPARWSIGQRVPQTQDHAATVSALGQSASLRRYL